MLNLDLSYMDSSVMHCVNPYDVNPIRGAPTAVGAQEVPTGKSVKLEMEEFSDLAPYLPEGPPKATSNFIDELNTPIFDEKGPFDFMISENTYIQPPAAEDPSSKFENDILNKMRNSVLANKQLNDFSVYSSNINFPLQNIVSNSEVVNTLQGSEANMLFTTSETDQGDIYIVNGNETPIHAQGAGQVSASQYTFEDNSVISAKSIDNQYSNVSSPSDDYNIVSVTSKDPTYSNISSPNNDYYNQLDMITPEDSYTGSEVSEDLSKFKLNLGFTNQGPILNTPDVIADVVDLETSFNIFDFVNSKDPTTTVSNHFDRPTTSGELTIKAEIIADPITSKRSRKRKQRCYEDDDEDYVPPSCKKRGPRSVSVVDSESDSDVETSTSKKVRPPRRTSSISSDHSDASKYRELRDKNNEASRRSRLKRKVKEKTLEKEADELEEKNVKLRAQVEELDRMVNNFRNNLFKIMLKK